MHKLVGKRLAASSARRRTASPREQFHIALLRGNYVRLLTENELQPVLNVAQKLISGSQAKIISPRQVALVMKPL
jgi:hypothetical protein